MIDSDHLVDCHAIILAGGFGTRLQARVPDTPKVLAPLWGNPFLAHQLKWLEEIVDDQLRIEKLSYPNIALVSSIDWLKFRKVHPLDDYPKLFNFANELNKIEEIAQTFPE